MAQRPHKGTSYSTLIRTSKEILMPLIRTLKEILIPLIRTIKEVLIPLVRTLKEILKLNLREEAGLAKPELLGGALAEPGGLPWDGISHEGGKNLP